jgi:hypothetical protein
MAAIVIGNPPKYSRSIAQPTCPAQTIGNRKSPIVTAIASNMGNSLAKGMMHFFNVGLDT